MKNKLFKYSSLKNYDFTAEYTESDFKDKINHILELGKPIVLELACGKGEYTLGLASEDSDRIYIGIDIKGDRLYVGAKRAKELGLNNVYFLRMKINDLAEFFPEGSINEIWITHPDPFPKERDEKRRLTSERFLEIYKKVLVKNGIINLKTDNTDLFEFSIESMKNFGLDIIQVHKDIYKDGEPDFPLNIETYYGKKHREKGETLKYLKARL